MKLTKQPSEGWRWMVLLMVLINVSFNYVSEYFISGPSVLEVSNRYHSLFTPAPFSFSIWGLIYFSFFIYAIYQLLPSRRDDILYDKIAQPFILANLFAMCWVLSFRMNLVWLSLIFTVCMLITAMMMYTRVRHAILRDDYTNWLSVPFSLFAGWLCIATITNVSVVLISYGLQGDEANQVIWSTIFILLSCLLGVFVCFRCRDFVFPAVISWACVGIFAAQQSAHPFLGLIALVGAMIPITWVITALFKRVSHRNRVWGNKLTFSDTFIAKVRRHKLA